MAGLNNFSIRAAEQVYKTHDFSRSHQLKILGLYGVPDYVTNEIDDLNGKYYATSYSVPEVSIDNTQTSFQGFKFNIPGQMAFPGTYQITLKTAGSYLVRNALERWIFSKFNPESSCGDFSFPCPDSIIELGVMAPDCSFIRGYRLIGIYPQNVGAIEYNQENVDLTTFTFTLQYQRWEPFMPNEAVDTTVNQLDGVFQSFESTISTGVGKSCNTATSIPRV